MRFQKKRLENQFCFLMFLIVMQSISTVHAFFTPPLFQNRFFSLSTDQSLLCLTSEQGALTIEELVKAVIFYEKDNPDYLRKYAVSVLTDHHNAEHLSDLSDYDKACESSDSYDFCVLEHYWGDEETALRVLALFYDTKTIIKHGEDYRARRFTDDHIRAFEKAIRKIPPFLRKRISHAKPLSDLDNEIAHLDSNLQSLIKYAFPEDFATSIWSDASHPLTLVPGVGFQSQVVAQVFNGQNLIIFTVKAFDKAKDGRMYRDIDLKYLVDFRLPIIVHEIAHTIDNFHFWDGKDEMYFFYRYKKISNDNETLKVILNSKLALWPSKWFEAFEYLWEVNEGRYDGQVQEKLAELVAQYILIPERLLASSPDAYHWLKREVFKNIEYKGYDDCPNQIVKPLSIWQYLIAKLLGQ